MTSLPQRLAIVYVSDGKNETLTYASIASFALAHDRPVDIHLVQSGYDSAPPASVEKLVDMRGHRLARHRLVARDRHIAGRGHLTPTTCARFEAADAVVGDCAGLVYFDTDVLFMRRFDLATMLPRRHAVAAVPDLWISTCAQNPRFFDNCRRHGLSTRYLNAGVLALDSQRWTAEGVSARFDAALAEHQRHCPYNELADCGGLDQCALNLVLDGAWDALPIGYNTQKSVFQTRLWDEATIRHFTGPEKFLPVRAHRADAIERHVLRRVAEACPELGIRVPGPLAGIAYGANSLRRTAQRRWSARRVAELLQAPADASGASLAAGGATDEARAEAARGDRRPRDRLGEVRYAALRHSGAGAAGASPRG